MGKATTDEFLSRIRGKLGEVCNQNTILFRHHLIRPKRIQLDKIMTRIEIRSRTEPLISKRQFFSSHSKLPDIGGFVLGMRQVRKPKDHFQNTLVSLYNQPRNLFPLFDNVVP